MFAEKPDPPTELELTDQTERSVKLIWIPGDENNSPVQSMKCYKVAARYTTIQFSTVKFEIRRYSGW